MPSSCPDCLVSVIERVGEDIAKVLEDGKVSLTEAWGLVFSVSTDCVAAVSHLAEMDVAHKRQAVIDAVVHLWVEHIVPLDLPGPDAIIDPAVTSMLPYIVGGIFDAVSPWKE